MDGERLVGGLRCLEVLDRLAEYVDGDLAPAERARVEAHLVGCDACARFGGAYADLVAVLRQRLASDPPDDVSRRLLDRLQAP
ncbi:MAG TPA: zf-HC2 domain-containing protein [Myxococcota bacterium]|nr:zf-HC2 domain-containing protein [Myxococcota bacterium]